jgi:hypothetical protein
MYSLNIDESWVKGSLHCHSTFSDGFLSLAEVVDYYLSRGYGLLAITDHGKIATDYTRAQEGIFLTGIEISKGEGKLKEPYHIVGLGVDDPGLNDLSSPSEVIDEISNERGLAVIAHPYWSSLVYEDLIGPKGYAGIEVYNTGCDVEVAKGYATTHWDSILSSGVECLGFAVDDAHRYFVPPIDADGGWIWLKNVDDSESAIRLLRRGQFYSSTGPVLRTLEMSDRTVTLRSTPVNRVNVVSHNGRGLCIDINNLRRLLKTWKKPVERRRMARMYESVETNIVGGVTTAFLNGRAWNAKITFGQKGIEQLEVVTNTFSRYIRVEVLDQYGHIAWSNPILLN